MEPKDITFFDIVNSIDDNCSIGYSGMLKNIEKQISEALKKITLKN